MLRRKKRENGCRGFVKGIWCMSFPVVWRLELYISRTSIERMGKGGVLFALSFFLKLMRTGLSCISSGCSAFTFRRHWSMSGSCRSTSKLNCQKSHCLGRCMKPREPSNLLWKECNKHFVVASKITSIFNQSRVGGYLFENWTPFSCWNEYRFSSKNACHCCADVRNWEKDNSVVGLFAPRVEKTENSQASMKCSLYFLSFLSERYDWLIPNSERSSDLI